MRSFLSGVQIPSLARLNVDGEFTLDSLAGTSGQILTSAGAGNTPTWNSDISVSGNITAGTNLRSSYSAGDEGGQIFLNKSVTNTSIISGVNIDVYQNRLRIWEDGGTNRGVYIDMTTVGAGVGTNLVGSSFTGGTLSSDLILAAGSGSVEPITFQTNSATPATTSGAMDYDGTVFYATSKTNPGRALLTQNYYYLSSADVSIDMSSASLPLSLLTTATTGITVPAGTTYDYEAMFAIRGTFIVTSQTPTITISNLSGTATVAHTTIIETGNNTTGFTTASTLGTTRITAGQALTALSAGSRYYIVKMRGVIRVTGSGTAEIAPTIRPNTGSADNGWLVQSGAMFKLTPIGNGTVTTVGTWA